MPFTFRHAGSAIACAGLMATALAFSALPGLAQTSGQAPKPKQPAPKAQQAKPQQAQPQQAKPQNAAVTVALKAEPSQPEWTKVCGKDQGANAEVCYTTRDFVTDKGQRVAAMAVYDAKAKAGQKLVRIMVPLGFLVPPGTRIVVDKNRPVGGRFSSCLPHGCFVEAAVKDDFVAAIKKGTNLNVTARNQAGKEITFVMPIAGFGKAFDGPPIDPQILAERQKQMQEEIQKRAEELRSQRMSNPAEAPAASAGAPAPKN